MDTHIEILENTNSYLLALINEIDRNKTMMINSYPYWDDIDTVNLKALIINRLNTVVTYLEGL
jgi:hypothetical protein